MYKIINKNKLLKIGIYSSFSAIFIGIYYYRFNGEILVDYQKTEINNNLISKSNYMTGNFNSCYYHPFRFVGIIWGNKFDTRAKNINYEREIFYTSDKENLAIDWVNKKLDKSDNNKDICVIFTGIFGTSNSNYIKPLAQEINKKGFNTVVINPRGLGIPILQDKFFSETCDIDSKEIIEYLSKKYENKNIYLVGTSLGSSLICRYLTLNKVPNNIKGYISISNPYDVYEAAYASAKWYNIVYGHHLVRGMKKTINFNLNKMKELSEKNQYNFDFKKINNSLTTFSLDLEFTKKIYPEEYKNPKKYYNKMGCTELVKDIKIPSLFINSENDPISHSKLIPYDDIKKNENIILLRTPRGGHVEFFTGLKAERWYTKVASEYLFNLNQMILNK